MRWARNDPKLQLERLETQLAEIEALLRQGEEVARSRVPSVSGWSVAQHLDHVLLALERSLGKLLSNPSSLSARINWVGRAVLAMGWFPRGVARAPKGFEGRNLPTDVLHERTAAVRGQVTALKGNIELFAREEGLLKHPYFGALSASEAVRFLAIHTGHHLKIVRAILRNASDA